MAARVALTPGDAHLPRLGAGRARCDRPGGVVPFACRAAIARFRGPLARGTRGPGQPDSDPDQPDSEPASLIGGKYPISVFRSSSPLRSRGYDCPAN